MPKSKLMLRPDALRDLTNRVSLFPRSAKSRAQHQDVKRERKVSCVLLGPCQPPPRTGTVFLKALTQHLCNGEGLLQCWVSTHPVYSEINKKSVQMTALNTVSLM